MSTEIIETSARYPARLRERLGVDTPPRLAAFGNLDLLTLPKTALFCSARCPGHAILDEIDMELARRYEFTAEELDFILNYDIKYRLGRGGENEEE